MGRTVDRSVLVGIGLVVAVLVVNAGLAYWNTWQLDEDAAWVAHTHDVLDQTGAVLLAVVDAETSQRGFLITGREDFLQPYEAARARVRERTARLKETTQDNARQQARIPQLEDLIARRLELLNQGIDLQRRRPEQARAFTEQREGQRQMQAVRALVAAMQQEEHDLLRERQARSRRAYRVAIATGLATALMAVAGVAAFVGLLARSLAARQRAAADVEAQREWLRVTLASVGDAVIATDTHGRVVLLNPVAERLTGWQRQEAQGQPLDAVFRIINEHTREAVENPVSRVLREGTVVGLANHTVLLAKGGEERPVDDSAAPIREERGNLLGVVLIFRDVTERRAAEAALREVRALLHAIVQHAPACIFAKDRQGRYLLANRALARLVGRSEEDFPGRSDRDFFPPEVAEQFGRDDAAVIASGQPRTYEESFLQDGATRTYLTVKFPLWDETGTAYAACAVATEITDLKRTEEALRAGEERLRLALEAGRMGVWDWDVRIDALRWSDNLESIHGLAPGSFGGTRDAFQELVHPDDRALVNRAMARALEDRSRFDLEFRVVWPDGSVHWVAGKGQVISQNGQPARMIGVGMDVTARQRAEQDARFLADASAALAGLVDYESTLQKVARLAVPTFADWCTVDMLDEGGALRRLAVAHVDPSKVELAHELHRRYPPDPNNAQGVWNILRTGNAEVVAEITDELLTARVQDADLLRILRALGLKSYMGVPLSVRGRVLGVVTFIAAESGRRYDAGDRAVAEDLAHRAAVAIENGRLYQAVREADRRKDEFLALLGHELRNPLAPIRNGLHLLKQPGADAAVTQRAREIMERQVEHLVRLVDDLLDVSRIMRGKVELRRTPIELAVVVSRAVETAQPVIDAEGHALTVALPPEPLWVNGDLVRLTQVVANLLHNAAKYTERGGRIGLTVCREGEAVLRVRDTGIGIAPHLLPRLFDMFFQAERRTREAQGGLGIGLSLVRGLVELHDGKVEAHSAGPGTGSEFVVRLPLLERGAPGEGRQDGGQEVEGMLASRRVLVADDNVDAADSLAMLLRLEGQQVQVAYDGTAALALAEADPPAMAFVDLGMPKMDGYELARRLRARPALKDTVLVALTGWGQPEDRQRTRAAGFDRHLVKPIEPDVLRGLLDSLANR